ncbi:metallo-beta-lactamase [Capsaspora owczarzaki ATCC 30864]|uniref:Metallo-beta-lactamase n=1 Tax=Capsaspora owczarzaki (strain ATCC 30864) TaxID=595528 RepID=A0A0D2WXM4_CAPO3|nr:metallo-beta-lactamase [Capsaspora owczarzaki ATCC 30864]KJE97990.1 metallo-beta-lactamase [Capsaspora owczarzaki ATCC 30864]|eukprot:XP_004342650.1 metallo-beta-lactamase [Capsaspora owczarzaki ATCC 30864]
MAANSNQIVVEEVIFLGTGTSGQIPSVSCLSVPRPTCAACVDSVKPNSRNRRRNTSLLVRARVAPKSPRQDVRTHSNGNGTSVNGDAVHTVDPNLSAAAAKSHVRNIVIDVGKSFYEGAIRWFLDYGITDIHAVVLTHEHADAVLRLDDLRDWTMYRDDQPSLPVFLDPPTMAAVSRLFPYMVDETKATGSGLVPKIKFCVFDPTQPFNVLGVEFAPFVVPHGKNCTSLGFRFSNVTYLSDVSDLDEKAYEWIDGSDIFIVDTLKEVSHVSHFGLDEALAASERIRPAPRQVYLTGMCHLMEHHSSNKKLAKLYASGSIGMPVECAYDGLRLDVRDKSPTSLVAAERITASIRQQQLRPTVAAVKQAASKAQAEAASVATAAQPADAGRPIWADAHGRVQAALTAELQSRSAEVSTADLIAMSEKP